MASAREKRGTQFGVGIVVERLSIRQQVECSSSILLRRLVRHRDMSPKLRHVPYHICPTTEAAQPHDKDLFIL